MRASDAHRAAWVTGLLTFLLSLAGCTGPLGPSSPVTLTLEPDESVLVERTRLRFVEVVSDSRCPLNAFCITQGDVVVSIEVTVGGSQAGFELALNNLDRRSARHRGIIVSLEAVQPYPVAGTPINPDDYRATLELASD